MNTRFCQGPDPEGRPYRCTWRLKSIYTRAHQKWIHVGWHCKLCNVVTLDPNYGTPLNEKYPRLG